MNNAPKQINQKHKTLRIIIEIISIILIAIAIALGILYFCLKDQISFDGPSSIFGNERTIRYTALPGEYELVAKSDYILVKELSVINCIQAPCEPLVTSTYNVKYTPESRDMFDRLFKNEPDNYISTYQNSKVTKEDRNIMNDIVSSRTQ